MKRMYDRNEVESHSSKFGLMLGVGLGLAFGVILDNYGVGALIGVACGTLLKHINRVT